MYRTIKSLILIAASCAVLAACGGNGQSSGLSGDAAQAKHLTQAQKSTAAPYATVVEQLYVAYFGRPADPTGLSNFGAQLAAANAPTDIQGLLAVYSSNATVKALIDSFGTSGESQKLYGNTNPTAFVQAVFSNVLGRMPQTAGLNFWVAALNSGSITYGNAALQIMAGALANNTAQGVIDTQLINNRITVALDFTGQVTAQNAVSDYSGSTAAATARNMLGEVDSKTDTTAFDATVNTTVASLISSTPVNNVAPISVDSGADPANVASLDEPYVSVTICSPSNPGLCQTIDHILVDTGSNGLRIISTVLNPSMAAALSAQSTGNTLNECTTFIDGYTWGPIRTVTLKIAGETASNLNMQVIGDPDFAPLVPGSCSGSGKAENSVVTFGSNGVIGVGLFQQDCGSYCSDNPVATYFMCSASTCNDSATPLAQQVTNPISLFAHDNNGVIISLPAVAQGGAANASGTMTFGVNTQSDNTVGSASVFQMNNLGNFTTVFNGTSLPNSFIDSGSNGLYFPNLTNIATCSDGFYCPSSPLTLSATMQASDASNSQLIQFVIGDVDTALGSTQTQNYAVYVPLGAPNGDQTSFDWGLPFFFGRNVFVVIEGKTVNGKVGPLVAF